MGQNKKLGNAKSSQEEAVKTRPEPLSGPGFKELRGRARAYAAKLKLIDLAIAEAALVYPPEPDTLSSSDAAGLQGLEAQTERDGSLEVAFTFMPGADLREAMGHCRGIAHGGNVLVHGPGESAGDDLLVLKDSILDKLRSGKEFEEKDCMIARRLAEAGSTDEALEVFQQAVEPEGIYDPNILVPVSLSFPLALISKLAEKGHFEEAFETADKLYFKDRICMGLACIASEQAKAGLKTEADGVFQLALAAADGHMDEIGIDERVYVGEYHGIISRLYVAAKMSEAGLYEDALLVVEKTISDASLEVGDGVEAWPRDQITWPLITEMASSIPSAAFSEEDKRMLVMAAHGDPALLGNLGLILGMEEIQEASRHLDEGDMAHLLAGRASLACLKPTR